MADNMEIPSDRIIAKLQERISELVLENAALKVVVEMVTQDSPQSDQGDQRVPEEPR